jgi:hypothetical protein
VHRCASERDQGYAVEPRTGRKFFLDYPCDLKANEQVVFILSLHGAGSIGHWQRHYFPAMDYKERYRLVICHTDRRDVGIHRPWRARRAHVDGVGGRRVSAQRRRSRV